MYQYPTGGGQGPLPQRPAAPPSVLTAVKFMYAGAALSALGFIISLVTVSSVRTAIRKADPSYTSAQIHTAEIAVVGGAVLVGLIGVGLWLWMAWANGRGRSWARIVASVLFAINTLDLFLSLARPHAVLGLVFSLLVWLAGLGAIVFLWRSESSAYFSASKATTG